MSRVRTAVVLAGAALAGGCGWLPAPASAQAREIVRLWRLYTIAAAVVGGIVIGLIVVAAVRFRRRAGDQELPRQRLHAVKLEITYLTLPLLLVAALVVATVVATDRVLASEGDPDVTVDVIAYRWQWYFAYEGEDVVVTGDRDDEPELVLPAPAKVRFEGTSRDVIHALWVPEFLFKRDLVPGYTTTFDVDTVEVGEYWGRCAEFCGLDHAVMSFRVRTVSPDEFGTWLDDQRRSAAATPTAGGRP